MKCQVPSGIPGIFPFVWHGNHVRIVQVRPLVIATLVPLLGRRRVAGIALQPVLDDVVIELLGPEHSGKALAHHVLLVGRQVLRNDGRVKFVGLNPTQPQDPFEVVKCAFSVEVAFSESQADDDRLSRTDCESVMSGRFGPGMRWIHSACATVHHIIVDAILDIWSTVLGAKQTAIVSLILGKEQLRIAFRVQPAAGRLSLVQFDDRIRGRA